jgi:hypothetical protein
MGTFHSNLGALHGITVVVHGVDDVVYVGRCHEADDRRVILLDVDQHRAGEGGLSHREYLARAAKWGVFKRHDHLILAAEQVERIVPLGQLADEMAR